MRVLRARRLVTGVGVIEYPVLRIDGNGRIAEIESDTTIRSDETLSAAFLDVHTHGAAGHDVMEATASALRVIGQFFAEYGVGAYLATTVTAPLDVTLRSLEGLADAVERGREPGCATPVGIHLEGPFVSHVKRGVHPREWILPPTVEVFERLYGAARGHVRLMTIAPEAPGAMEVIAAAVARGVRVSLGHTNATAEQARAAIAGGAVSATHTYNAMRALDHREPGVLGVVLDDEALYADLICDGVHVAPELVRLWLRTKGAERAILVTDSMAAAGMPDGEYRLGGLTVQVRGGVCRASGALAGSVLTMDRAVANVQRYTGVSLATAIRLASANPARMLGLTGRGEMRVGDAADLNRYNGAGELIETYLAGGPVRA